MGGLPMHKLEEILKNPGMEYRNETRWWLAEGMHTDETLKEDMQMLDECGFGGVEFLAMNEYGADSKRYGWGSEEWIHDSHLLLEEATKRGMAASMTSGTNWSNANLLNIVPDDKAASKELEFVETILQAGEVFDGQLLKPEVKNPNVHEQELIAVVASKIADKSTEAGAVDLTSGAVDESGISDVTVIGKEAIVLTDLAADDHLRWQAPEDGQYILFFFWMHGTGQQATPSCGTSYTVNYIDPYGAEALIDYWNQEVLTEEMQKWIEANGRVQLYMDSLELSTYGKGGQFWGYHLMEEFKTRRGYDLAPYLPLIVKKQGFLPMAQYYYTCGDEQFEFRLKNDLYQTMTDLYMENMLKPLQSWLHEVGMSLRAEISYGMPFEISQPGKYVDSVETESHEFVNQIDYFRGLSGTAHVYNHLFSSETGATVYNYKLPMNFYQQILYTQFAAGVARTVMHGYSSVWGSESATLWPGHEGMWCYFSERFGPRQPAFKHYKDWNKAVERFQYLLRQGKPRMDIGILRLDYTFDCDVTMHIDYYEKLVMHSNEGIYWKHPGLQNAGYTYDYFSPNMLEDIDFADGELASSGPGYQAIIVYQEYLPLAAAKRLLALAQKGLPVVLVNGVTESVALSFAKDRHHKQAAIYTPYLDGQDEELAAVVAELLALPNACAAAGPENAQKALEELGVYPRAAFAEPNNKILTCLRDDGDVKYLYLYNYMYLEKEPVSFKVSIPGAGALYRINCWTGKVQQISGYESRNGQTLVELSLNPGEATVLMLDGSENTEDMKEAKCSVAGDVSDSSVPDSIQLEKWHLQVESWDEGERMERTEDRGLGYVTKEYAYDTKKTMLDAGEVELKPWLDIPEIGPEVSGMGFYTCEFEVPEAWNEDSTQEKLGAVLKLGSTNGNTAAVYVNGKKADGVDMNNPTIDISELLVPGKNTLLVEVASTLNNRLHQKEYYAKIRYRQSLLFGWKLPEDPYAPTLEPFQECWQSAPQPYGLTGKAEVVFYERVCNSMEKNCLQR